MNSTEVKLALGALLCSIGKLYYRGSLISAEEYGYTALNSIVKISDPDILNTVRYHKLSDKFTASLEDNAFAYIVNMAKRIADSADFKKHKQLSAGKNTPLKSIFNRLNENNGCSFFAPQILGEEKDINYPSDKNVSVDREFYQKITDRLTRSIQGTKYTAASFNALLSDLEALTSFIPASASDEELGDISFYDNAKITAAIASCLYQYADDNTNYRELFHSKDKDFLKEDAFMLFSMDISGIQSFIYTISSKGALKSLRARSFYLEVMMEHVIDELLEKLSLSRANLIYSGGGHCYLLLPNTDTIKQAIRSFESELNAWFIRNYQTSIYVATGCAPCSGMTLENGDNNSLAKAYHNVSQEISQKKMKRYSVDEIRALNSQSYEGNRECRICKRTGKVDSNDTCYLCSALLEISKSIQKEDYFIVTTEKLKNTALPLPFDCYLVGLSEQDVSVALQSQNYRRLYVKNQTISARYAANHLWVGDYKNDDFDRYAEESEGISRLGILRADVDNLGATFACGFQKAGKDTYSNLARSATLSRMLSIFFKHYINLILSDGESRYLSKDGKRKVAIVYSGGDDVFLVGAWNEVIDAFVDLRNSFRKFSQNTLSLSGGVGFYPNKYPIHIMAEETEKLVECSKDIPNKDAITLFDRDNSFGWENFIKGVMDEKFKLLNDFFRSDKRSENSQTYGSSFLYNLLDLMRNSDQKINRARLAYLLSRMEPKGDNLEEKTHYKNFAGKVYDWYPNKQDRSELICATYIYSYIFRDKFNKTEERK